MSLIQKKMYFSMLTIRKSFLSFIHSLIVSIILIWVTLELEPIPGTLGSKRENTLDGMPVDHRDHTQTHIHSSMFLGKGGREVRGNPSEHMENKHAKFHTEVAQAQMFPEVFTQVFPLSWDH